LKSFDIVKDVRDACFHTYFSVMDDLRQEGPPIGKYYEIRFDVITLHSSVCSLIGEYEPYLLGFFYAGHIIFLVLLSLEFSES
jgi:hypothetical protein